MKWAVAVTSAPRKPCVLMASIESLRLCDWEPVVFAEPGSTEVDCETRWNESRRGVWHNWLESCRWALETGAEFVLTSQDDAIYHPDSRDFIESIEWPEGAAFISLYTPRHYSRRNGKPRPTGINRIITRSLWGAVSIAWRRDQLQATIDHKIARTWAGARPKSGSQEVIDRRRAEPWRIANSDTAIGKICNARGRGMYFIDPSPVAHAAVTSTVGHGGNGGNRNAGRLADHSLPLDWQVLGEAGAGAVGYRDC